MLTKNDTVKLIFFILSLYLLYKLVNKNGPSTELSNHQTGGLVALTDTSKLLVTDDTGNLSTYTPATEGFKTNELKVTGTSEFAGAVNLNGGVTGTTTEFTGNLNAKGGITGTTAEFTGNLNLSGGACLNGRRLQIGGNGDTAYILSHDGGQGVQLRGYNGGKLSYGIDASNAASLTWNSGGVIVPSDKKLCIGSTCLTEQDFKNVVNNLKAGGEEFNTYTPQQWFALFPNGGRKYHTVNYRTVGISTTFDTGNYGECETIIPSNPAVKILQTIRHSSYTSGTGLVMRSSLNDAAWGGWEYKFYRP